MFGRVWIAGLLLGTLLSVPGVARAGDWPWPVAGRVGLPYAETWTDAAGTTCSHGGLDVEAPAGASVSACAGGRVAFAGRIPAAGGGSALAVSVVTPDGLRVTYMPLSTIAVATGIDLVAGEDIGELAGSGDGSLAASHLHMSVRRGEAPIDPATLLSAASSPVAPTPLADARPPDTPRPIAVPDARVGAGPISAGAPVPAGVAVAPTAVFVPTTVPLGTGPVRLAPPLGPRIEARIRPLPYEPTLDIRAALEQARTVASAGRGLAIRVLLALLAAVSLARIARAASRVAEGSVIAPAPAHARRAHT